VRLGRCVESDYTAPRLMSGVSNSKFSSATSQQTQALMRSANPSLAHISTKRAAKRRRLTEYEFMIEFGRFYTGRSFKELIKSSIDSQNVKEINFMNNYLVLPGRLNRLDNLVPDIVRSMVGHNIGCLISKK